MASKELVAKYLAAFAGKRDLDSLVQGGGGSNEGPESARSQLSRESAREGLQAIKEGRLPSSDQTSNIEAIILPKIRPVLDIVGGDFRTDHPLWQKLNDDTAIRQRLSNAIPAIGRIELPGNPFYPYGGTGFVVGDGLIMTNRHVAAIFAMGIGTRKLSFQPGLRAGIDFLRELGRPTGPTLTVKRVVMIHPYWDMALLAVEGLPATVEPLGLSVRDVPSDSMIEVAVVGYPAFDTRNDSQVQNDLFREVFGVKRLQPGLLGGREQTDSFGKKVPAIRHDASTLGGNSGSAVIDLSTGEVMALHFGGRYGRINFGVPACELAKDQRVVDMGVRFAGATSQGDPPWVDWWNQSDESAERDNVIGGAANPVSPQASASNITGAGSTRGKQLTDGSIELVVPLHITVRLGHAAESMTGVSAPQSERAFSSLSEPSTDVEAMVTPWHDEDFGSRTGYDPLFLDPESHSVKIPMPSAAKPAVLAVAKDGSKILHYQSFSIAMHAKRRMALFTASNVTAEVRLKKPEPGRDYSRKGLSGLGKNDQERWFPDSRLNAEFQLPDVFYTNDNGAFDKGHIVRREDVAWGKSYDELRRANGDTYHVTNCSPQVAGFNRSNLGDGDNWGSLENFVLSGASSERYCQFAGPVLDDTDDIFVGSGGGGVKLRVKIPSRFWKVIVVLTQQGVASYGFVLDQDLSDVPLELIVPDAFVKFMEPLTDIQEKTGVKFPPIVLNADQYGTMEGAEMAFRTGARRRSLAEGTSA